MTASTDDGGSGPVAPEVITYYERSDEAERLESGAGIVERERTRLLLRRFLPPPPATVLDVGGGAGAHAFWLTELGYETHLSDPVPKHVDQARATADRTGASLGSIRLGHGGELSRENDSVDAVVALGPLYHLPAAEDREQVHAEVMRVLRPGGVVRAWHRLRTRRSPEVPLNDHFDNSGNHQYDREGRAPTASHRTCRRHAQCLPANTRCSSRPTLHASLNDR